MKNILISIGVALLVVGVVYVSIIFFYPKMNLDYAFGLLLYSFLGSAVVTALVLMFRKRRR